ncbi:MAG: SpoIID/LytB domain-containing protein [Sedimentisphaerales bacterium]|nr:SpoIID/LytB domain-containing protein [Sedimentisphaerales bacterium]
MRRTVINCLLMGVLLIAGVVFFSCRERLLVRGTPQMGIEPRFWVRVLLADDVERCTVQIHGGFSVLSGDAETLVPETIFIERGVPMNVWLSGGELIIAGRSFAASELTILPDDPFIFTFDGNDYRGKLTLRANDDGASLDAVNVVPLEPYLAGVVGAEMPDYWESEALKAQAITARTYCLFNKLKFGSRRHWDVTRTQASQVYLGLRAESPRVWEAVNDTLGQVLVCRQDGGSTGITAGGFDRLTAGGEEDVLPTYYSSTCGGHTEDAKNVFGDAFGPLCGVDCPYCRDVTRPNVFFWPMVQFDKAEVTSALQQKYPQLKELGDITSIVATRQSDYADFSRLTMVKLTGSTGRSEFLRAEDLRLTIDPTGSRLRSTSCRIITMDGPAKTSTWAFIDGRGFGHGVGLCQCGAEGMARKGKTAEEILSHYYPGSKLIRAY